MFRLLRALLHLSLMLLPATGRSDVLVHAAASLSDVLGELAARHESAGGAPIRLSLGGSNMLARQILAGAPGDVFLSADEERMDELERAGLLAAGTRVTLLTNELVVVVAADSPLTLARSSDLARDDVGSIALADPGAVPAGRYARAHLERAGAWESVRIKVIPLDNVRSALAAVEAGNADAAIVYATDARTSKRVRVACRIPASEAPPIRYAAAVLASCQDLPAARAFLAFLRSGEAARVFSSSGFGVPE